MLRKFVLCSICVLLADTVSAGIFTDGGASQSDVVDRYIGAIDHGYFNNKNDNNPNNNDDAIGTSVFEINSTSFSTSTTAVEVSINSNFMANPTTLSARLGDLFLDFNNYTPDRSLDTPAGSGGELNAADLADGWYGWNDNWETGTQWGYAVRLLGDVTAVGDANVVGDRQDIELWKIDTTDANTYRAGIRLSNDPEHFGPGGSNYRNGQEVRVNADDATNGDTALVNNVPIGGYWINDGSELTIRLEADILAAFGIASAESVDTFAYHWAMTCGNDTVENDLFEPPNVTDVPEPASLAIFGFGLLGLGVARRRRNRK